MVSVGWLEKHLGSDGLVVLDSTWFLPRLERSGKNEFLECRIDGALFFDYDEEAFDDGADFPRMMPSVEKFQDYVRGLGVSNGSQVVVYDNNDMFSSPRAWWMFKAMGLDNVAVLDGGLKAWVKAGNKTVSGHELSGSVVGDFNVEIQDKLFVDSNYLLESLDDEDVTIVDARAVDRYKDSHIPGAKNIHYAEVLCEGKMKEMDELRDLFRSILGGKGEGNTGKSGVDKVTFSCGSGVTACVLALGATVCGYENLSVYDASWSEWGKNEKLPKESS